MLISAVIIIAIILGIIALFGAIIGERSTDNIGLTIAGIIFISIGTIIVGALLGEKDAYKEALKGNNPYKMEVRYELQDSIFYPKDTVFTKIEK